MQRTNEPISRPSARVVLLDEEDHILLLRVGDPNLDVPSLWLTPGGAPEGDESYQQAALRELAEETGLTNVTLGPWIWARRHVWRWGDRLIESTERFFLVRTPAFSVDTSGMTANELHVIQEYRWWSVEEIEAATHETFVPRRMAQLLNSILVNGIPPKPIDTGV